MISSGCSSSRRDTLMSARSRMGRRRGRCRGLSIRSLGRAMRESVMGIRGRRRGERRTRVFVVGSSFSLILVYRDVFVCLVCDYRECAAVGSNFASNMGDKDVEILGANICYADASKEIQIIDSLHLSMLISIALCSSFDFGSSGIVNVSFRRSRLIERSTVIGRQLSPSS